MRHKIFIFALLVSFIAGCGYKPTSVYAKKTIGDSVFAFVEVFPSDPENSVAIKDAVNEAIVTKFHSKLAPIETAQTKMYVKISSVTLSPIQYDTNGYVVLYRMNVALSASITDSASGKVTNGLSGAGSYDFSVAPGSSLPEEKRFTAIQNSASKAIDMLVSQIAVRGVVAKDVNRSTNQQGAK